MGIAVDLFGVLLIVFGMFWATILFVRTGSVENGYSAYRIWIGRALLGLEVLVAADIIRTVALEPTFENLGVLSLLVLICTLLN